MRPGHVLFGRFEVERLAAAGAMGVVYRGIDRQTRKPVAIKVPQPGSATAGRFEREASILRDLDDAHIVRYVADGRFENQVVLVMDWVEGEDLGPRIRSGMSIEDVIVVGTRVARALAYVHAKGILHRDVKPSNISLPDNDLGRAMLIDFGVARPIDTSDPSDDIPAGLTLPGLLVGTPPYMAPEQIRGERTADGRADLFALGCVLYKCLAKRGPFEAPSTMGIFARVLFEEPSPLFDVRKDISPELEQLILQLLEKEPSNRPASADVVADAFTELASTRPSMRPPAVSLTESEQRFVCFVLAAEPEVDVVDPEATIRRARSISLDEGARELAAKFDARLEVLADGLLAAAVTGARVATDQVARAARLALALREHIAEASIRVVLGTGRAELGVHPVGDGINRAMGLLHGSFPVYRSVRIDGVTAGLLGPEFDVHRDGEMISLLAEREAGERMLLGKPTPCIGREEELATLGELFRACTAGSAKAAMIIGAPGVGKSRLVKECLRRISSSDIEAWTGRGDAMTTGSPFACLAQMLRETSDLRLGEPSERARAKLRARVARNVPHADQERVALFLGEIVGVHFPDDKSMELRSARSDPELMSDQTLRAWLDFLEAELGSTPLVLVLEDAHWADLKTVRLLDAALRVMASMRLMVLITARPQVDVAFPNLFGDRRIVRLQIGSLSPAASEALVLAVLGNEVDPRTVSRVIAQSDGNPVLLEELIRAAAEGLGDRVPETVLAIVQARLDALPEASRRTLRAASIIGRTFWRGAIAALIGSDGGVDDLVQRELVVPQAHSRFAAEKEYTFAHDLLREAAYSMLVDRDRTLGHRLAAEWLERAGVKDDAVIAEHFDLGGVRARAAEAWTAAAEQAAGHDLGATLARAKRALAAGSTKVGELALLEAEAHLWRGDLRNASSSATRAVEILPRASIPWFRAVGVQTVAGHRMGDLVITNVGARTIANTKPAPGAESERAMQAAVSAACLAMAGLPDAADDAVVIAEETSFGALHDGVTHRARAMIAISRGGWVQAHEHFVASHEAVKGVGDTKLLAMCLLNVGVGWIMLGSYDAAKGSLAEALAISERLGLTHIAAYALMTSSVVVRREDLSLARALVEEALPKFVDEPRGQTWAHIHLSEIARLSGDVDLAEREGQKALSLAPTPMLRAESMVRVAQALLARGDVYGAENTAREAMHMLRTLGSLEMNDMALRRTYAEALLAVGKVEVARDVLREARDRLMALVSSIRDPAVARRFLEITDHARILELAQ